MSDEVNTEEVQPINPEPAQPIEQAEAVQETSPLERPENIPEKFWDAEKGEIMTDEFLKSYTNLEQYVGGKKEELKDELIDELSNEAMAEKPEEYTLPALPESITEEQVMANPMMEWWENHCDQNAYDNETFQEGINKYIDMQQNSAPDLDSEMEKLGENADARLDAVDSFANSYFSPDQYEIISTSLGQSAEGIEILERIMDMNKQTVSQNVQSRPINQLSLDEVRSMMKDPRYFDSRHRDESYVRKVDDAFQRLYRG